MKHKIPKTLDNPMRAMGIPIDTLVVGIVIWMILYLCNATFAGLVAGSISAFVYQRYRKRSFIRMIARRLYWYMPASLNPIKQGIKGYERRLTVKGKRNDKQS